VHTAVLEEKTAFPSLKSDFESGAFFFPQKCCNRQRKKVQFGHVEFKRGEMR